MNRLAVTLDDLRRFAISRSLFEPLGLKSAVERLGFVQADPIRAPARAQDLTLRQRVRNYHAGDLERRYPSLGIEEDVFINYGFVSSAVHALMHPRDKIRTRSSQNRTRAGQLLAYVREQGEVHPRDVDAYFAHGTVVNYWGGSSSATTHLLDDLHYRGLLRVTRRERGIRLYAVREPATNGELASRDRLDALADVAVAKYAPVPAQSLAVLVRRLRYAVPHLRRGLTAALVRAMRRLAHARVDGIDWYWPAAEDPTGAPADDRVRLLAPFDPVVWDRRRFELFWDWSYRFEAYTPVAKRKLGYYALPMLWRDRVIGWSNLSVTAGDLRAEFGYVSGQAPRDQRFRRELAAELERMREFLAIGSAGSSD